MNNITTYIIIIILGWDLHLDWIKKKQYPYSPFFSFLPLGKLVMGIYYYKSLDLVTTSFDR
jgi:hypothetical protein